MRYDLGHVQHACNNRNCLFNEHCLDWSIGNKVNLIEITKNRPVNLRELFALNEQVGI
ncbi:MAG: hypothetical protein JWP96_1823 [Polaromonas sp.]|jgi:hypothetical protein|nr:hypothetical protein [Polaromonas sp.]